MKPFRAGRQGPRIYDLGTKINGLKIINFALLGASAVCVLNIGRELRFTEDPVAGIVPSAGLGHCRRPMDVLSPAPGYWQHSWSGAVPMGRRWLSSCFSAI